MTSPPAIEDTHRHDNGNWRQIAAWLLDLLDQEPPPPGSWLNLCLCHHANDAHHFADPRRDAHLAEALLEAYKQERQWDSEEFGELRFDLSKARSRTRLRLTLRPDCLPAEEESLLDRLSEHWRWLKNRNATSWASSNGSNGSDGNVAPDDTRLSPRATVIEFSWHSYVAQIPEGSLGLVRRQVLPLSLKTQVVARLTVAKGTIAPHLHRWQGRKEPAGRTIHLPPGRTELIVGNLAGCDIKTDVALTPFVLAYDSGMDEWSWMNFLSSRWRSAGHQLNRQWKDEEERTGVSLLGERLPVPSALGDQKDEAPPTNALEIIGLPLPLPRHLGGYGKLPEGTPDLGSASSALKLPEASGWLYLSEGRQRAVYWLRPGQSASRLDENAPVRFNQASGGHWHSGSGLPEVFHGELRLDPPMVAKLANDGFAENLPDDLFDHVDSAHGRPPVRLSSTDSRGFRLVFNKEAKHPLYLKTSGQSHWQRHPSPSEGGTTLPFALNSGDEFIVGATHYRLSCR